MAGRADTADIEAFIDEHGVGGFPHVLDADGSIWNGLGVTSQPAFVFINHTGSLSLHYGSLGLEDLTAVVEQLKIQ